MCCSSREDGKRVFERSCSIAHFLTDVFRLRYASSADKERNCVLERGGGGGWVLCWKEGVVFVVEALSCWSASSELMGTEVSVGGRSVLVSDGKRKFEHLCVCVCCCFLSPLEVDLVRVV